jgi:hypothetical protein
MASHVRSILRQKLLNEVAIHNLPSAATPVIADGGGPPEAANRAQAQQLTEQTLGSQGLAP